MPQVSIVMNCLNGEKYLREALDSIEAQTFQDWEVIFWDNGSTDSSARIAREWDPRLRYFYNAITTPLGAARNAALKEIQGRYVAFLDTDDTWLPVKLERQLALFSGDSSLGLVHSDVIYFNETYGKRFLHFDRVGHKPPRGWIFPYLLRENSIAMPSVMLDRRALDSQPEWFDLRFEIYPDYDLFRRIAREWKVDYVDEPLAVYRIHSSSSTTKNYQRSATELEQTIRKFRTVFPNIDTEFPDEMARLDRTITYQRGKALWQQGKNRLARKEFATTLKDRKIFLSYLLSWLPFEWVEQASVRLLSWKSRFGRC